MVSAILMHTFRDRCQEALCLMQDLLYVGIVMPDQDTYSPLCKYAVGRGV